MLASTYQPHEQRTQTMNNTIPTDIRADNDSIPFGWQAAHALSVELAAHESRLSRADHALIIDAIRSNLPVAITFMSGGRLSTVIAMVDRVTYNGVGAHGDSARLRVRYWGFGHDLYLANVRRIDTAGMVYDPILPA